MNFFLRLLSVCLLPVILLSGFTIQPATKKSMHPFYITVTEMNYNATTSSLEMSCKLFTDDFEQTLRNQSKTAVDLAKPKDEKQLDNMVFQYVKQHLQLKLDGKPAALNFVGFETEGESAWCYMEIKNVRRPTLIELSNTLLYESYSSQINIIHAVVGNTRKSTKLVNPEKNAELRF